MFLKNDRKSHLNKKFRFYQKHGIEEYYLYDPIKGSFSIWLREGKKLEEVPFSNPWISPLLEAGQSHDIYSDRIKLVQILNNLLSNAIKFTPKGKEVKLEVRGEEAEVDFIVTDQGIGVPEDRQQAIFEPFEQTEEAISLHIFSVKSFL